MRLLLAEDDSALGRAITSLLMRDGHAVDWVTSSARVPDLLTQFRYDCLLLALGTPGVGAVDLLPDIRQRGHRVPAIVMGPGSSRDAMGKLLGSGADDYLIKPFELGEMQARVGAVVRRSARRAPAQNEHRTYGRLTLMPSSNSILWRERAVKLTGKEFLLLTLLVERRGHTVTRRQIDFGLNGHDGGGSGSNTVEVLVHQLRRKIDGDLIRTVRGIGYSIDPD